MENNLIKRNDISFDFSFKPFDKSKPMSIIFDETGNLDISSNVPWVVWEKDKLVFKPMILSMFLKYSKYDEQTGFNYILVKSSNTANENFSIYTYENGVYKRRMHPEFKEKIRKYIPQILKTSKNVNEVFDDLIADSRFVEDTELNINEDIINFKDGIYNRITKEFLPHSPKYLTTIQIPANYKNIENAGDEAPVFDMYMNTLCSGNADSIKVLMQCMGLCISNIYGYRTKKALFLIGKGDTGKSQIKKLIETFLGQSNISTADLITLNSRFGKSAMYGKRLVGCGDMSYENIKELDIFKQATGGDHISIEFKNGGFVDYVFKGFMWFNCNDLPQFGGDKGKHVYERIIPVVCKNVIQEKDKDTKLFDKMMKEKNVIIKRSLQALDELIKNNYKFEITDDMKNTLKRYETDNNTLLQFIEECCVIDENAKVRTKRSTFYDCYDNWCKKYNNGKGRVGNVTAKKILLDNFNEGFKLSGGIWYMDKIVVTWQSQEDLIGYQDNYRKEN